LLRLGSNEMRTLPLVMLVFAGQANTYVLRTKLPFWRSRPAKVMVLASLADVALIAGLATTGLLMSELPLTVLATLVLATFGFAAAMDALKRLVFSKLEIDRQP